MAKNVRASAPSKEEAPKPFDPEARRSALTRKPSRPWRAPRGPKEAIAYTLVMEHNPAFNGAMHRLLGQTPAVDLRHTGPMEVAVRQSGELRRLESVGAGVFGQEFTYISDPDQGLLFLSPTEKRYLHLRPDQQLGFTLDDVTVQTTVERCPAETGGKPVETRAVLEFSAPVRARFVLWLEPREDLREHGPAVFKTLFGCATELRERGLDCQALLREGAPVRGEFHLERGRGEYHKASWFEVRDLRLEPYDPDAFGVPKDYKDLRSAPKQNREKGHCYGKPRRRSTLRATPTRPAEQPWPLAQAGTAQAALTHVSATTGAVFEREGNLDFPRCFPSTYGSQIANLVDQRLLDDVRYIVNGVSRRLTGFGGSGGNITIDWLNQFEAHANGLAGEAGSGLFFLLRDPDGDGQGLLDKLSEASVRRLLVEGGLGGLTLPVTLAAAAAAVIANTAIAPEDRYDSLTPDQRRALREAYLAQRIAELQLTYPNSTPTTTIFHDLMNVRLSDIDFGVSIDNTSILSTLEFTNSHVHMVCALPGVTGRAWMARWPTAKLWAIGGLSALACLLFPPACALAAAAATVIVFLALDFAYVRVDLSDIVIDAEITLTPNANNVLQPAVSLTLDADVSVFYGSVVPTGVHQILSLIYTIIGSHTDVVLNQIESQLESKLNTLLRDDLAITYPPKFAPSPLAAFSNIAEFAATDRLFVQTGLNAGLFGVTNPFITQVDNEIKEHILTLRDEFKARFTDPVDAFQDAGNLLGWIGVNFDEVARYYLGSVLSQNFINHYIHALWRNHAFTHALPEAETEDVLGLLETAFPELQGHGDGLRREAHIWPAVSPRTVFTPKLAAEGGPYATTFFDDLRLCVGFLHARDEIRRMEFLFAAQAYTQIGFGGVNAETGRLDLVKTTDRAFDLYFDLDRIGATLIHPEIQAFRKPDMAISATVDYSGLDEAAVQEAFALALASALASRTDAVIPAQSGAANVHRYNVGANAFQIVAQMVPFKQNLYVSMGASGLATAVYEGALDIDQLDQTTALLIRAFIPV